MNLRKLSTFIISSIIIFSVYGIGVAEDTGSSISDYIETKYTPDGKIIQTIDKRNNTVSYYENGKVAYTTLEGDVIESYRYVNNKLELVMDQYQNKTYYENGRKMSKEKYNGEVILEYYYDNVGQLIKTVDPRLDPDIGVTNYRYRAGSLATIRGVDINSRPETTYYSKDRITYKMNDATGITTAVYYYTGILLSKVKTYDPDNGSYTGYTQYDKFARPISFYDKDNKLQSVIVYDSAYIKMKISYPAGESGRYKNVTEYNEYGEPSNITNQVENEKWDGM